MDITPTPELRAACRIVLGVGGLAAVIGAMRGDTYRWAQAASFSCIVPASRSLTVGYTIDAATLEFAGMATTGAIRINDLLQALKVDATADLRISVAASVTKAVGTLTDSALRSPELKTMIVDWAGLISAGEAENLIADCGLRDA